MKNVNPKRQIKFVKPTTLHSIECQSFKENTLSAFGIKRAVRLFIIFLVFYYMR